MSYGSRGAAEPGSLLKRSGRSRLAGLLVVWLCVATLAGSSCRSVDAAPPLFSSLDLPVTLIEFRIHLNTFGEYFVAVIDDAATLVIDESNDQLLRRKTMRFRLRAVNNFLNALNQTDPVASLVDAWVFCLQLHNFTETGAGSQLFGNHQATIVEATRAVAEEVERVVAAVSHRPATENEVSASVKTWAQENPLDSFLMVRGSSVVLLAELLERPNNSAFAALGRLQAGVDDLVSQYQRYISIMPRTIRWQSQLILHQTLYDELPIRESIADLNLITASLLQLTTFIESLPDEVKEDILASIAGIHPLIEGERATIIAEVDRQRDLIFAGVDAERAAIMADIERQINEVDATVQAQIDAVLARIETLANDTVNESFAESERLINLIYRRTFTLLLVALAGGAALVILYKRRHPLKAAKGPATPPRFPDDE